MSCYLTPSDNIENFIEKLNNIEDNFTNSTETLIIGGDFNSSGIEWGSIRTRGSRIINMAARMGIVIANVGNTATFKRPGCNGTIPDITMISEKSANSLPKWRVLEDFTGSDHNYIAFTIDDGRPNSQSTEKYLKKVELS